jgi:ATP-dependent 26S proteasome regulatory subunit
VNVETKNSWNEANQRYLMAALNVVQEELQAHAKSLQNGRGDSAQPSNSGAHEDLKKLALDLPAPSALDTLVALFGLSTFERKLLLLCAGVELDAQFSALVAMLQGSPAAVHPTFSLALAVFPDAHWNAVAPRSPLRYWRLIQFGHSETLTKSALRIDEQVLHYLTGVNYLDERLEELLERVVAEDFMVPSHLALVNAMLLAYTSKNGTPALPVLHLRGENASDKPAIAAFACAQMGLQLYILSATSVPATAKDVQEWSRLWNREATLHSFALFLDCTKLDANDKVRVQLVMHFIENIQSVLILGTGKWDPELKRKKMVFEVEKPAPDEQFALWKRSLGSGMIDFDEPLRQVISYFNLSAKTIVLTSLNVFQNPMTGHTENTTASQLKKLWKACCIHTRPRVEELAQRIEPAAGWNDIVLPEAQKQILRELTAQVRQRKKVYQDWGFAGAGSRGLGISALFAGESGTGKTMAAEVLANELQLDLYRIDLSQVVNKYIGETEKNLKQIFDAGEEGGAILLFDEADALFGKRSDVKDSHDRYSNIEVSYLLQRMEAYGGLAVLTTNMKGALDKAFLRRIRFVVQFPYPDAAHRAEIWRRIFPANTPVENLDFEKLSKLSVPGGNIRNIAINAAFIAADEGQPVRMNHIARAVRSEYGKIEKTFSHAETGGW